MMERGAGMDGILVVAKEPGFTSHDVVALVRRLSGTRKAGHGGTLDPFASGVLPVFLGLGTRVVEYHMADDKAYRATVCFGTTSETDDRDGELKPGTGPVPAREAVEAALADPAVAGSEAAVGVKVTPVTGIIVLTVTVTTGTAMEFPAASVTNAPKTWDPLVVGELFQSN